MPLVISRTREPKRQTATERHRASITRREALGDRRKSLILPADCVQKADALMAQHGVGFTDLVVSLIRSA